MDKEFLTCSSSTEVLIVGDGDYSFSVAFSTRYENVSMTATTLEGADLMSSKYPDFHRNVDSLRAKGISVITGVDATSLHSHFSSEQFTHILFNFPHVGGKSNIKKNRQLLEDFFKSASSHIKPDGSIMVTLCKGQGGTDADVPKREWCNSWQITSKGSNSGMILTSVDPFEGKTLFDDYLSTGFRSQNKRFHTEGSLVHKFMFGRIPPDPGTRMRPLKEAYLQKSLLTIISKCWSCTIQESDEDHSIKELVDYSQLYCPSQKTLILNDPEHSSYSPIRFTGTVQLTVSGSEILLWRDGISENVGEVFGGHMTINHRNILMMIIDTHDVRKLCDIRDYKTDQLTLSDEGVISVSKQKALSLHPPKYRFDVSFWMDDDFTTQRFYHLVFEVSHHLVKDVTLVDTFTHPDTGRHSHCYCLIYQSLYEPLSFDIAYKYYQHLRETAAKELNVELR